MSCVFTPAHSYRASFTFSYILFCIPKTPHNCPSQTTDFTLQKPQLETVQFQKFTNINSIPMYLMKTMLIAVLKTVRILRNTVPYRPVLI